jgi:putative signal transducing protein
MVELLKSNDLVLISYVMHLLAEEGIEAMVFDEYISAVEGSIGAFPRRIMVDNDDLKRSKDLLGKNVLTISG